VGVSVHICAGADGDDGDGDDGDGNDADGDGVCDGDYVPEALRQVGWLCQC